MKANGIAVFGTSAVWQLKRDREILPVKALGYGFPLGCFKKVFPEGQAPVFSLDLDLGAYGRQPRIEGVLDGEEHRYRPKFVRLPHMDLYYPWELDDRGAAVESLIRRGYDTYAELVGSGPNRVKAPLMLWGGGRSSEPLVGVVNTSVMLDLSSVGAPSVSQSMALHELGHCFAARFPPHTVPWYHRPLIGESWPTFLGMEASRHWYGDRIGDYLLAIKACAVLAHLGDEEAIASLPEICRQQFVEAYIRKRHGWSPMQKFFQLSYTGGGAAPDCLKAAGLTRMEAIAGLYSYTCGENLAWLYRMMAFEISVERVDGAMDGAPATLGAVIRNIERPIGFPLEEYLPTACDPGSPKNP